MIIMLFFGKHGDTGCLCHSNHPRQSSYWIVAYEPITCCRFCCLLVSNLVLILSTRQVRFRKNVSSFGDVKF
jgi:hypothetical protein